MIKFLCFCLTGIITLLFTTMGKEKKTSYLLPVSLSIFYLFQCLLLTCYSHLNSTSFSLAPWIISPSMIPHLEKKELHKAWAFKLCARVQKLRNNTLTSCHNCLCLHSRACCSLQPPQPQSCTKTVPVNVRIRNPVAFETVWQQCMVTTICVWY